MPLPRLKSPDGKVTRQVSTRAELEYYTDRGYTRVQTAAQKEALEKAQEAAAEKAAAEKAAAEKAAAEKAAAAKTPPAKS